MLSQIAHDMSIALNAQRKQSPKQTKTTRHTITTASNAKQLLQAVRQRGRARRWFHEPSIPPADHWRMILSRPASGCVAKLVEIHLRACHEVADDNGAGASERRGEGVHMRLRTNATRTGAAKHNVRRPRHTAQRAQLGEHGDNNPMTTVVRRRGRRRGAIAAAGVSVLRGPRGWWSAGRYARQSEENSARSASLPAEQRCRRWR